MEDRLVQVIKEKHLLTWKDGDDTGVGVGEYKMIFQHGNEIVIMSELNECGLREQTISEFMEEYEKDEGYRPHDDFVSWEEYKKFIEGMENIYGEGAHGTFKDVIHSLADGGVRIHRDLRSELEYIYEDIGKILGR